MLALKGHHRRRMPCRGALTTLAAVGAVAAVTASAPASPTSTRPELGWPYWAAGGRLIAFGADDGGGELSLWMMRADGKQRKMLAAEYVYASLSPSGRMVADFPGAGNDLVLRTVAGKGVRTFRLRPGPGDILVSAPVWSPDESSLVFEIDRETATNNFDLIFLADRRTGLRLLSRVRQPADFAPAWSPDGRRIAFVRCPNSNGDNLCKLMVMRRDGSGRTVIAAARLVSGRSQSRFRAAVRPGGVHAGGPAQGTTRDLCPSSGRIRAAARGRDEDDGDRVLSAGLVT